MLHSNAGELHQLYATFNRVWGEGGGASLSLETVDGKVSAVLKIQLGPPADPRPGAPEAHQAAGSQNLQPGQAESRLSENLHCKSPPFLTKWCDPLDLSKQKKLLDLGYIYPRGVRGGAALFFG